MLPKTILKAVAGLDYQPNTVGMSDSQVFCMEDRVLKISPDDEQSRRETDMLRYLENKLPVPRVLAWETLENRAYLVMSRVPGKMLCDSFFLEKPTLLLDRLAQALRLMWQVDVRDCPLRADIGVKLRWAQINVEQNRVDIDNTEPETFGPGGFASPEALLRWLIDNQPEEDALLTHGDCCLPNLFADENGMTGFIDLGRGGVGSMWQDIALAYRSLHHNYAGVYGSKPHANLNPDDLFSALGIAPDRERLRYYLLLDELF